MKKLITLLLTVLPFLTIAQEKGTDKIIIKTDKTVEENFKTVKLQLAEKGIEIASQDADIHQIKTGVTPITKYGASAYYIIFCKDNEIQIKGMFNTGIVMGGMVKDTDPFRQIVNRKLGLYGVSWQSILALAKQFGTDISYSDAPVRQVIKDDVY